MAYTALQIVALAVQIAKAPGYLVQAGQFLNAILEELYQTNDFAFVKKKITLDLTQGQPAAGYALPSDHERTLEVFYTVSGASTPLIEVPLDEYDLLFSGPSDTSYPEFYSPDVSQTPHTILFYPVPPLAVGVTLRYLPAILPITSPETSTLVPWFSSQLYLIKRLSSELMMITDDLRQEAFAEDAEKILSKFLTMAEDDRENYARQVKLDPRAFKVGGYLKSTKNMPL